MITFRCQEREIEPIDEIVCLLPWGLETTLSVLIGDQKKDNVQFIPPGKVKSRERKKGWEVYLIKALEPILLCKRNPSNLMVLIMFSSKLIIDKEWINSNNEHWLENILLLCNVNRNGFLLVSSNKERQYWLLNVNGKLMVTHWLVFS